MSVVSRTQAMDEFGTWVHPTYRAARAGIRDAHRPGREATAGVAASDAEEDLVILADRAVMSARAVAPWAVILAGGDGVRLQPLTMMVAGDARPKQFCPLLGPETLLERTRRRVDLLVRFDRQVVAVSRPHEVHYRYLYGELMPGRLAVQPENRDTGPGILYALLRVKHLAGNVPVAVFPSDHYVDDDHRLDLVRAQSAGRRAGSRGAGRPDRDRTLVGGNGLRLDRASPRRAADLARRVPGLGGSWRSRRHRGSANSSGGGVSGIAS